MNNLVGLEALVRLAPAQDGDADHGKESPALENYPYIWPNRVLIPPDLDDSPCFPSAPQRAVHIFGIRVDTRHAARVIGIQEFRQFFGHRFGWTQNVKGVSVPNVVGKVAKLDQAHDRQLPSPRKRDSIK